MKTSLLIAGLVLAPVLDAQLSLDSTLPVGSEPNASALFDLDGDGDLDLAVAVDAPDRVDIYRNNGNAQFTFAQSVLTGGGSSPHTVVAGNFGGDAGTDLAVSLQNINQVRVLINNGGTLTAGASVATGTEPRDLVAFDANGGLDDLASANRDGNSISVLLNNNAGGFSSTTIPIGSEVRGVASGDFNGDGSADLVASAHDTRRLELFTNNGAGAFSAAGSLLLGAQLRPEDVVAGDLDGDGDDDLATAASGNALNVVTVFVQTGANTFSGPSSFASGGADPSALALLDANVDGNADILVANTDSNNVGLLINSGAATFGAATTIAVGVEPGHVAVGDLDGNGSDDATIANETSNSISVLVNVNAGSGFENLGGGLGGAFGIPQLAGEGTLAVGSPTTIQLTSAATNAAAALVQSLTNVSVPFKGGVLVPAPDALLVFTTDGAGSVTLSGPFPAGLASGSELFLQVIVQDAAAPLGFALSNALRGVTP